MDSLTIQHRTKTSVAVETLRTAIVRGEIGASDRITIARLTQQLGMSATPIREAIRILEVEGLIRHRPHHSVSVADLSEDDAAEIYMLRGLLEPQAVRLAVPFLTDQDLSELQRLEHEIVESYRNDDRERLMRSNADWHLRLYLASRSPYLQEFIQRIWTVFPWDTIWAIPGRTDRSLKEHSAIMHALNRRDAPRAAQLLRKHIVSGQHSVMEYIQTHGGVRKRESSDDSK